MTDTKIQTLLIKHFNTLNSSSGIEFLTGYSASTGEFSNVSYPNTRFTKPEDKRFFVLTFLPGEPEKAGLGKDAALRWSGVFQIDIHTALDVGESESHAKYEAIHQLFQDAFIADVVDCGNCYRATAEPEEDTFRTIVRIEWTADIE